MKKITTFISTLTLTLTLTSLPTLASSTTFNTDSLPYSDVEAADEFALPISVLTNADVLEGNPDGTFLPDTNLNRAEFLKIVVQVADPGYVAAPDSCFPDVQREWFSGHICAAKLEGIVAGYPDGFFHPERNVNYAEVTKILVETFDLLTPPETEIWYSHYIDTLENYRIALTDVDPANYLTRGQMAQLTARFYAYSLGALDEYLQVEQSLSTSSIAGSEPAPSDTTNSSSSSQPTAHSSSTSSSSSPLPDGDSTERSLEPSYLNLQHIPTNPLPTFTNEDRILVLGEKAHEIGIFSLEPAKEPVLIEQFRFTLTSSVDSIYSLEVVDEFGFVIGNANQNPALPPIGSVYTIDLSSKEYYFMEKDQIIEFAVRPIMKDEDSGGESGETIKISSVQVFATGYWTNNDTVVTEKKSNYLTHQTALATIESIENAGDENDILTNGTDIEIAAFTFTARSTNDGEPALESITFNHGAGNMTLSNLILRDDELNISHSCTTNSSKTTCSAIPISIGRLLSPRTLRLYADISNKSDYAQLQVSIKIPGSPASSGDITWTDGENSFDWVPFSRPIVRGTLLK